MKDKLALEIEKGADGKTARVGVSVSIDITNDEGSCINGLVVFIPQCTSYVSLAGEVTRIKEELDTLLERSREAFGTGADEKETLSLDEEMSARELWDILSKIENQETLSRRFNILSRQKRFEVADYVLTHCNVFSGAGSVFSIRYNSKEGLLE